ncbi:FAD-binding oxidoreductase [Candidatus Endoriftia persephone]|jgi:D-lactate dehydrogenase|uniref:Glycolate oxidase subunit glcD n=2 Tax=Gammaproteobacteria TaxID=1236 RepID=G2DHL1_9GAMM|nr:FAD-linked oxidase C-terminal domain-containing protein [Candidatus Endoriftia persephone]EGV49892.1 glycolate oxidase subunit glcD [endosymbiont of Riftia pachyptila (vent Ph05)]USF88436.1 FAD-binding protein [Candidatus Endoriftia persephone]
MPLPLSLSSKVAPLPAVAQKALKAIVGSDALLTEPADCLPYGYDNSRQQALPQAVVFASEAAQIEAILALCNRHQIPLTPRGAGTGTTGATVPDQHGIVLSLERMDRILDIDPGNRLARVEPGVTNQTLQLALAEHGFFWPPDPTSASVCTIGGNLAYNSAGPRAVKYGTPRENTLGLQAVTGAAQTIRTGVNTTKGVVGYDLTRLLIGSEGTLAIITEATLKLTPLTQARQTLQASYRDIHAAAKAVSAIMAQPTTPCALEFMDGAALEMVRDFSDLALPPEVGALLMIEVDGASHSIEQIAAEVATAATVEGLIEIHQAKTTEEIAALWKTRKALSPALRNVAPKKINEDVVVPVSHIPRLIDELERLSAQSGITIINFGHAGNGNIHVNLLLDPDDPLQMAAGNAALSQLFDLVLALGGTISGEHGVGLAKRDFVPREIDPPTLELMRAIKRQFDPNNILNPGKLFTYS